MYLRVCPGDKSGALRQEIAEEVAEQAVLVVRRLPDFTNGPQGAGAPVQTKPAARRGSTGSLTDMAPLARMVCWKG